MNKITICIPTYKRGEMLRQLLESIRNCAPDPELIGETDVIVVDNDAEKSAENLIIQQAKQKSFFRLHYHSYSVKGLANVRNELINKALELHPDFIVFIDDDEFVTENWLVELVKTIIANDSDAARGPVLAKTDTPVSPAIERLLKREDFPNNTLLNRWTTGNLILRRTSLEKYGVRFDKRFNATGSEDTFFGKQMEAKGARIYWAANAVTYEVIPEKRTKPAWFFKRTYRGAGMYVFILKLEKDYKGLFVKMLVSMYYVLLGLLCCPVVILPVPNRYWGIIRLIDGVGGIAGVLNLQYSEYK